MDFYKGILMFGVIWGHSITNLLAGDQNNISIHWIMRTYDMPMFMVISGYFLAFSLAKCDLKTILKDKMTTILFPVVLWDLITTYGTSLGHLYFLWAIFLSSVITALIAELVKSFKIQCVLFAFVTVLLNFIPLSLWNLSYLFPFFAIGYIIGKQNLHPMRYIGGGGVLFLLFVLLLSFWTQEYKIRNTGAYFTDFTLNSLAIVLFRYAIGFVGCWCFAFFMNIFYEYYTQHRTSVYEFVVRSGKETLALYILQDIFLFKIVKNLMLFLSKEMGYNPLNSNEAILGYVIAPVLSLSLLFLLMKMIQVTKSCKYTKYAFGGKFF